MEFLNGVSFLHFFFFVSLLASHAESMSIQRATCTACMGISLMPEAFADHPLWDSSAINSFKFTNLASLKSQQSSPSLMYTSDHAFQGFTALLSQYGMEVPKKPPRFSLASNEKISMLYPAHPSKFFAFSPSLGIRPASSHCKSVIVIVIGIHSKLLLESESFKDDGAGQNLCSSMCSARPIGGRFFNKGKISRDSAMANNEFVALSTRSAISQVSSGCVDVILLFFTFCTYEVPLEIDLSAKASLSGTKNREEFLLTEAENQGHGA